MSGASAAAGDDVSDRDQYQQQNRAEQKTCKPIAQPLASAQSHLIVPQSECMHRQGLGPGFHLFGLNTGGKRAGRLRVR